MLAALVLGAGMLGLSRVVMPAVPADGVVKVSLRGHREGELKALGLSLSIRSGSELVQTQRVAFGERVPAEWSSALHVKPGDYHARTSTRDRT